jgi:hypothetical protein
VRAAWLESIGSLPIGAEMREGGLAWQSAAASSFWVGLDFVSDSWKGLYFAYLSCRNLNAY